MLSILLRTGGGALPEAQALRAGAVQHALQAGSSALQGLAVDVGVCARPSADAPLCQPSTSYTLPHPHHPLRLALSSRPATAPAPAPPPPQQQLQQTRAYRIPVRVPPPKVPYSVRSGRPAPQPWPELEPLKAPSGEMRWHRSVVRFPPEVEVELVEGAPQQGGAGDGRAVVVSGRAGSIRLDMQTLDPTGLLAFRLIRLPAPPASPASPSPSPSPAASPASASPPSSSAAPSSPGGRALLALLSPDRARFEAVGAELNAAIRGVMSGYLVGLVVKGVGYRLEPVEGDEEAVAAAARSAVRGTTRSRAPHGGGPKPHYFEAPGGDKQAVTYPHNKPASAIRLKVGYSRSAVYPLPPHVRAFFLKPTLLYLYGLELAELRRVAAEVRAVRPPNPYTGNGVQYLDEVIKLKQRAGAK